MDHLHQFATGLLLSGINILVPIDDIQVDSQILASGCQRPISFGNVVITLRPQVPNGRRILDQKSDGVLLQLRDNPSGIRTDGIPHPPIEAIVNMRQNQIEVWLLAADGLHLPDPVLLHPSRQLAAEIEERAA